MKKIFLPLSLISAQLIFAENLSVIVVDDTINKDSTTISSTTINKTEIENSVVGNGFISSLLESNPNVEVTDDSENSEDAGEITPGKISFHNAPFYQNNVQLDGVSNNSLIDPNLSNPYDFYDVPGNENETFVDLDLVRKISVYDSNISAEYGNFTGGIIDVETIRPKGDKSFKVSYKHTSDKFTNLHFGETNDDFIKPKFEKHFFNMNYSTPINDTTGILTSFNQKISFIPKKYFGGYREQERKNSNFMFKVSHFLEDDSVIDVTANYSPYESFIFLEDVLNSDTTIKGGGASVKSNYEKDFDFWSLKTGLALKFSENTRDSANTYKRWIYSDDKNWGIPSSSGTDYSKEGGFGSIKKEQKGIDYKLKFYSNEFETSSLLNKIKTGLELSYDNTEYNRAENTYSYTQAVKENVTCNGNTEDCEENEQYFTERRVYQKENVDVGMVSTAAYIEDRIKFGRFEITPGIRVDYNNFLKNTDLAYRLNSTIKPFNNESTVIYGGLNRYYGKSFLGFKLREARTPYFDEYRKTNSGVLGDWGTSADRDYRIYKFSDLDTPFADEKSLGIKQKIFGMSVNLKYVHRDNKNQFTKEYGDYAPFTLPDGSTSYYRPASITNSGKSTSKRISLIIGNTKPVNMGSFNLGYRLSTSWTDFTSNSSSYDSVLTDGEEAQTNKVYYNGQFVDDKTIAEKEKPNTYNLHLNLAFNPIEIFNTSCKINVNNIIKYTSSYNKISDSGKEATYTETLPGGSTKSYTVKEYEDVKYKDAITMDLKANFNFELPKKESLILTTEVNNVFDKVQNVTNSSNRFKTGRQFWFNASYKF